MVNTILIVILVVVLAFALLALIAGLIKGIYKTAVKTLIEVGLIIVFIFLTPSIANAVGNIDFSNFEQSFTLTINDVSHTIQLTTIQQTLADIITATGLISPINGISIYQTAIALATSLLSYVLFFVEVLLLQLFIWLITAIIYNGIFRWFLPVETRKEARARKKANKVGTLTEGLIDDDGNIISDEKPKKKLHRLPLVGGLLGACGEFCLAIILISPITSMARIIVTNRDTLKPLFGLLPENITNDYVNDETFDTVENSAIMKLTGLGGIDSFIMDKASEVEIDGQKISLTGLINASFDIAAPLINSGALSDFKFEDGTVHVAINYSILLSDETVNTVVNALIANPMIMALIPPIIDMGVNTLSSGTEILRDIDLSNIDWSSEISIVNSFYKDIYGTGLVSSFITDDGKGFSADNFSIPTADMTDATIQKYVGAVKNLGSLNAVEKNMPSLLAGLGSYFSSRGYDVLPSDPASYEDVNWSHDLGLLVETVLKAFRLLNQNISLDTLENMNYRDEVINLLKDEDRRHQLQTILLGDKEQEGLLDLDVLEPLDLTEIMVSALEQITPIQPYIEGIDLEKELAGFRIGDLKSELSVYFNACDNIFSPDSFFMEEGFSFDNLDWGDEKVSTQFVEILNILENSQIFNKLYGPTLKTFLHNTDIDLDTYLFGLTPYDFNYDSENFLDNFKTLVGLLPDIKKMTDSLNDDSLSNAEKIQAIDTDTLRQLLDTVANSDFFNADKDTGTSSQASKNANFYTLLNNLFQMDAIKELGLSAPEMSDISMIEWGNGHDGKEIDLICDIFDDFKTNADFFLSDDYNLEYLRDSSAVSDMLTNGLDSQVLSPSILQIIDTSLNDYLQDLGIPVSFQEMRVSMWKEDADNIAHLLDLLKGLDLDNLDFDSIEPERLNAILTILAKSNFINSGSHSFGYVVYSLLQKQDLFSNVGVNPENIRSYFSDADWSSKTEDTTLTLGDNEVHASITTEGEIKHLSDFFRILQKHGGMDAISDGKLPTELINELTDPNNEIFNSKIITGLFSQVLENAKSQISFGENYDRVLDLINFDILSHLTPDEVNLEVSLFARFYNISQNGLLKKLFSDMFNLNEEELETVTGLIRDMSKSKLLTTVKEGERLSPVAELFYVVITEQGLLDLTTLTEEDDPEEMKNSILLGILSEVKDWAHEGDIFANIVVYLQGMEVANLDIVNVDQKDIDGLEAAANRMNESDIFHRVPISLLKNGFGNYDIYPLLSLNNTTHTIDFTTHLTTSVDDVEYWHNDIFYAFDFFSDVRHFLIDGNQLENIIFGEEGGISTSILSFIGNMNVFEHARSYIAYNLIQNSLTYYTFDFALNELFMPVEDRAPVPYLEDSDGYRFEVLEYSNPKLQINGDYDSKLCENDLNMFNDTFVTLARLAGFFGGEETGDSETVSSPITSIIEHTIKMDGSNQFYRSDLSSEIVAGIISYMLNKNTLLNLGNLDFFDYDGDKEADYLLVNPIEGRAIDAILELIPSTEGSSLPPLSPLSIQEVQELLNSFTSEKGSDALIDHFLDLAPYSATYNSLFAVANIRTLANLIRVQNGSEVVFLYDLLGGDTLAQLSSNSISFAAVAESLS